MLFLIDIHWKRRSPLAGKPDHGTATYAEQARYLNAAKSKAIRKFNHHFGMHLSITQTVEKADPAGIFS
jgi:hypothetical protein